jgi:hypothetical protein
MMHEARSAPPLKTGELSPQATEGAYGAGGPHPLGRTRPSRRPHLHWGRRRRSLYRTHSSRCAIVTASGLMSQP